MTAEVERILEGLLRLGARLVSHLMVHASLSSFGRVAGSAVTVVAALRAAGGEQGAVVIPSFRDAIRADHYSMRECQAVCPQSLCSSRERGYTGAIGEVAREQPDALRSCHPHAHVGGLRRRRIVFAGRSLPKPDPLWPRVAVLSAHGT